MRPRFEKDIRAFGEMAKEEPEPEKRDSDEELENLSAVLSWHLEKAAQRQGTALETQKEIYDIQKNKQEIMRRLKENLSCLDNPECQPEKSPDDRPARFDEAVNLFKYSDDSGEEQTASFGELVTDMDWGVNYAFEKTAPRLLAKKYLVARAKQKLGELLDSQIIKSEAGGTIALERRRLAYKRVEEELKSGEIKKRWGFISETIVKNFLKKLSLDKNLPFEIFDADIFQDVEQKIDFVIRRKEKARGVGVEADEKARDIGIQFSISPQAAKRKKEQIEKSKERLQKQGERVQDIALVIFPLNIAGVLKEKWEKSGRPAGGPDKFLRKNVAEKLFSGLLKGVFAKEEVENYWKTIEGGFAE